MGNSKTALMGVASLALPVASSVPSIGAIAAMVVKAVETGDTDVIRRFVRADLIQHSVKVPSGRDALIAIVEGTAVQSTRCEILRVFGDFDHVVVHSLVTINAHKLITIHVFRFESGLIVEQWSNVREVADDPEVIELLTGGVTEVKNYVCTEDNAELVLRGLMNISVAEDRAILREYLKPDLINRVLRIDHGLEAFIDHQCQTIEAGHWDGSMRFYKAICEGDFALLMSAYQYRGSDIAQFEILRIEDAKVAERWVVAEKIPEKSDWVGTATKF